MTRCLGPTRTTSTAICFVSIQQPRPPPSLQHGSLRPSVPRLHSTLHLYNYSDRFLPTSWLLVRKTGLP